MSNILIPMGGQNDMQYSLLIRSGWDVDIWLQFASREELERMIELIKCNFNLKPKERANTNMAHYKKRFMELAMYYTENKAMYKDVFEGLTTYEVLIGMIEAEIDDRFTKQNTI